MISKDDRQQPPGTVTYRLPNDEVIFLKPATRDLLIDRWALKYRPGDI